MSIFFDLFNPNNRHRTEELRRLENTREDESPGEPGRGPIDLNSGTVLIRVPAKEPAAAEEESAEGEGEDVADGGGDGGEDTELEDSGLEDSGLEDTGLEGAAHKDALDEGPESEDAAAFAEEDGGA